MARSVPAPSGMPLHPAALHLLSIQQLQSHPMAIAHMMMHRHAGVAVMLSYTGCSHSQRQLECGVVHMESVALPQCQNEFGNLAGTSLLSKQLLTACLIVS